MMSTLFNTYRFVIAFLPKSKHLLISWLQSLSAVIPKSLGPLNKFFFVFEVTQLCPTLCNPMDCNPPGSSVHGILQARILEWVAISFSRGSSGTRDQTRVSRIAV